MNRKAWAKFVIFIGAMGILVPVALLAFSLLTQFIGAFQQGADPASIFHGHQLVVPKKEMAQWLPFTDETELPTQAEQEEIIAAYIDAWNALGRAQQTGDLADLATYWAGSAYQQVTASIDPRRHLKQIHSGHRLALTFMSTDGSVVTFQDKDFTLTQTLGSSTMTLTASAEVVMTLDQGFWRIRSIRLTFQGSRAGL